MMKRQFWKETFERAVKTAAQGAVAGFAAAGFNILDMSQLAAVGTGALTGFVLSVITSIASAPFGQGDSPSVVETAGN
jgi:hypothetical protein